MFRELSAVNLCLTNVNFKLSPGCTRGAWRPRHVSFKSTFPRTRAQSHRAQPHRAQPHRAQPHLPPPSSIPPTAMSTPPGAHLQPSGKFDTSDDEEMGQPSSALITPSAEPEAALSAEANNKPKKRVVTQSPTSNKRPRLSVQTHQR